jgi:urease accessory protein
VTTTLSPTHWAAVSRLPTAFAKYEDDLLMRPAGGTDKTAYMRLHFKPVKGRTRLLDNFAAGINVVHRIFYMDQELPDLAVAIMQSVGAGIIQGDRIRTDIQVGDGARALVTTQGATKLHEMTANYATQRIDIQVGRDAYAEVIMGPLIPCKGSRLYTELNFTVAPSSVLVYQDILTSGRIARGESFEYDLLYTRMCCYDLDGRLLMAETAMLEPKRRSLIGPGLLNRATDVGTMYVVAPQYKDNAGLAAKMHDRLQEIENIDGGASVAAGGRGVCARILASRVPTVEGALHSCWEAVRKLMLGVGVPRIYATKRGVDPSV